jgi:hypothetical protein
MSSATVDEGTFTIRQRLLVFLAALVVTFVVVLVLGFVV